MHEVSNKAQLGNRGAGSLSCLMSVWSAHDFSLSVVVYPRIPKSMEEFQETTFQKKTPNMQGFSVAACIMLTTVPLAGASYIDMIRMSV